VKQLTTVGIILNRIDYGEADRILTLLTPDYGKLRVLAKGVRRIKSKMAGGIELFSVSQLGFIKGQGGLGTLTSTRLETHYGNIVTNLERTMAGYEIIKRLDRATEEGVEQEFFDILKQAFEALNDDTISLPVVRLWFGMQLLEVGGRSPNLVTDDSGEKLITDRRYTFDVERMSFRRAEKGHFTSDHIKILRLARDYSPPVLAHVAGSQGLVDELLILLESL
jgi:DNA repair protein RecO (recombination protein O)